MANKKLSLFVLRYSVVDACIFFLARDERDLFEKHSEFIIDDTAIGEALNAMPEEKRHSDAAQRRVLNQLDRDCISRGVASVHWSESVGGRYSGEVRWESYDISDAEIAFLRRLGVLEAEKDVTKAS